MIFAYFLGTFMVLRYIFYYKAHFAYNICIINIIILYHGFSADNATQLNLPIVKTSGAKVNIFREFCRIYMLMHARKIPIRAI